jgi:hypothetical protein
MQGDDDRQVAPPLAYRLCRFLGRPFGLRWVPDNHLGAVYRMEMYHSLRGPGFFWINPLTQTVKGSVSIQSDFISTPFPSLQTKDGLQLGLRVALAYVFDPRPLPREKAVGFVQLDKVILRAIVSDSATSALQSIMRNYYAEQVCRGEIFETIGQSLMTELTKLVSPLAITPTFAMVLEVMVPSALQETFTAVANRAAYTHDLSQYQDFELNEVRRRELNAVLSKIPGGVRYLNVSTADASSPSWRAGETPPRQVLRGTSRPLPSPPPGPDTDDEPAQRSGISRKSHIWDEL